MIVLDGVSYLTVNEACALLGVKAATIYAYVSRGVLRSYKQGIKRQRLYREDEVRALMEIQPSIVDEPIVPDEPELEGPVAQDLDGDLPPAAQWIGER
jgi:citrate synthase